MTNSNAPRGAQSFNGIISSKFDLRVNKYLVAESDSEVLFINDFVKTTGQSDAEGMPIVTKVTSQNDFIVGIVVSFEEDPAANLPIYRKASTKRFVYICDDPFVKFECQVSADFSVSDVGKKANLLIGSGNINIGISTTQLDSTSFTDNDAQIKILRLVEREDNELGTHAKVECTIFKHEAFFFDGVIAGENIFVVRQNGDDTQDGKSWEEAFETVIKSIDEANAVASVSKPILIWVCDGGAYSIQAKTLNDYVTLYAPNAKLLGDFIDIEGKAKIICDEQGQGFFDFIGATASDIAYYTSRYVNGKFSPINTLRVLGPSSVNVSIKTLEMEVATGTPFGVIIDNALSVNNVIKIDTILLGANNVGGINVNKGHAQIIVGQIIKTGAFTGTTGIRVAAGATADITILGKNEADTPLNVTDHNHNLISTDQGILIRGSSPILSAKGYASTQSAAIETSFAEGTPASPATILPTPDLGSRIAYGERQDGLFSGPQPYVELLPTTQAGDIENGKYVITVNDVQAAGGLVVNHTAFSYAAKTGGAVGELGVPLTVAGLPVDKFTLHGGHIQFGTPQQIASAASPIPYDGSLPLIGEGTLISDGGSKHFSLPYVLKSTADELKFTLSLTVWVDADAYVTVAVFESIGSSCIGKRTIEIKGSDAANNLQPLDYTFYFDPVNTVSRTYTARIGPSAASALTVNGEVAGEAPTINYSSFTIEEVPA